jgi:hypothetical protein
MESRGKLGAAPEHVPSYPRNLHIRFVYFVFLRCPVVRSPEGGGVYIVGFRSTQACGAKFCSNWTQGGKWAPPCVPVSWPCGGSSFPPRGVPY